MRITKKDIYNQYGVNYNDGKIQIPGGEYVAPLLKTGNAKTGKSIFTYSQLAGCHEWTTAYGVIKGTCAGTCPNCYGCAGFYKTNTVKNTLALHTAITRESIDFKTASIIAQIKADKIDVVRVHASGDFDSIEDVKAWLKIASACPDTLFYTYTKRTWSEIDILNGLPNVNIVPSIINNRFNFGTCSELLELKEACPGAYLCPCGFDDSIHCEDCKACATEKHVIFLLHSTPDYIGELDPLYNTLKALLDNQKH